MPEHKLNLLKLFKNAIVGAELYGILWYNSTNMGMGVILMSGVIAGILVCAFVYVIRESLMSSGEEDV